MSIPESPGGVSFINVQSTSFDVIFSNAVIEGAYPGQTTQFRWEIVQDNPGFPPAYNPFDPGYQTGTIPNPNAILVPISGLSPSTTYWFHIRAEGVYGVSAYSPDASQQTTSGGPTQLLPPTFTGFSGTTTSGFTASWSAVANSTGYQTQIDTTSNFNSPRLQTINENGTSISYNNLLSGVIYYFRVKALGNGVTYLDSIYSSTQNNSTTSAGLTSVTLTNFLNPSSNPDGEITGLVSPNTTYPLTLDAGNSYTYTYGVSPVYSLVFSIVTNNLTIFDGANPVVRYGYDSSTNDFNCYLDETNPIRPSVYDTYFESNAGPTPLSPPTFSGFSGTTTSGFTASWSAVANSTGYQAQIDTKSTFNTPLLVTESTGPGITTVTFNDLLSGVTYYFRVKALGDGVTYSDSGYSSTENNHTLSAGLTSITLTNFFNPSGNGDNEITGLVSPNTTYPLTLNAGNSYTYTYVTNPAYSLVFDISNNNLTIFDGANPTVRYGYDTIFNAFACYSDNFDRASVYATYFTTPSQVAPYIYIRPVVSTTTIRYNWEISTLGASTFTLTCESTDGGSGGGTVSLDANTFTYTFTDLTFGKTYSTGLTGVVDGSPTPSSIYRTVTTGNVPDPVENVSYTSTPTTISFGWDAPAAVQTPSIGWYVIKDSNTSAEYCTRFYVSTITIPFNQTPHTYNFFSVSDTGYSSTIQVFV